MAYPSVYGPIPEGDLQNWNTDRSVDPPTMVRGMMYKSSAGTWEYWDGSISGVTVSGLTTAPLSADSSSVSAVQGDAGLLRVSSLWAHVLDASNDSISAVQGDAGLLRVSALGVTASTSPLSADSSAVSAKQENATNLRISAFSDDAGLLHVSALGVTIASAQSLSATLKEGTAFVGSVSANQAGTWAISALGKEGTAFLGQVSAILKDGGAITQFLGRVSVVGASATGEGTANIGSVSAILRDNTTITNYIGRVSSIQEGAGNLRVSAVQDGAAALNVSCKSDGAGLFRTSSYLPVDTVGQLTAFRSLSLSASQAIKATAGAIYGYYLWNTTTVPQYVKFTNTSGAINVGTDTPIFMAMLPASAAANVWFGQGLKGFTAGIGVHASSAVADNATTPAAASAVGGTIFYN